MRATYKFLQRIELLLLRGKRRALLSGQLGLTFDLFLLSLEFVLLLLDLCLLLFESVDEDGGELIVTDAFNLTLFVAVRKQWFHFFDLFRSQAEVVHTAFAPGKADRTESVDDTESAGEGLN